MPRVSSQCLARLYRACSPAMRQSRVYRRDICGTERAVTITRPDSASRTAKHETVPALLTCLNFPQLSGLGSGAPGIAVWHDVLQSSYEGPGQWPDWSAGSKYAGLHAVNASPSSRWLYGCSPQILPTCSSVGTRMQPADPLHYDRTMRDWMNFLEGTYRWWVGFQEERIRGESWQQVRLSITREG